MEKKMIKSIEGLEVKLNKKMQEIKANELSYELDAIHLSIEDIYNSDLNKYAPWRRHRCLFSCYER